LEFFDPNWKQPGYSPYSVNHFSLCFPFDTKYVSLQGSGVKDQYTQELIIVVGQLNQF